MVGGIDGKTGGIHVAVTDFGTVGEITGGSNVDGTLDDGKILTQCVTIVEGIVLGMTLGIHVTVTDGGTYNVVVEIGVNSHTNVGVYV